MTYFFPSNCDSEKSLTIFPSTTAFARKSGAFLPTSVDILFSFGCFLL